MKSIDEAEAQARLDQVIEEVQRQPIVIQRQGNDTAVVLGVAMTDTQVPDDFVTDEMAHRYLALSPPLASVIPEFQTIVNEIEKS